MSKGFKSGAQWNGNSKGAPKKEFRRDDFTEELFAESKDDIRAVKNRVIAHALNDQPWAIKLVCEYFMTKPKSRDDYESNVHANIVGKLSDMPNDKLIQIQNMLLEQMNTVGEG